MFKRGNYVGSLQRAERRVSFDARWLYSEEEKYIDFTESDASILRGECFRKSALQTSGVIMISVYP